MNRKKNRADYGQDMPGIIVIISLFAVAFFTISFWQFNKHEGNQHYENLVLATVLLLFGILLISLAVSGIWSSRYGKIILRDKVMSKLSFKGSETVLDIGCGKGLLLIEAAKRIPQGKAVGADLWDQTMEYKYVAQMALDNAKIEGVSARVEVVTADVQSMPFIDNSFDVVMTSLMMHHVPDINKALKEMVRVLKPGGTIIIADVNSKRFVPMLQLLGLMKVESQYVTKLFLVPAYMVTGLKLD
jgi:arsenite methyltransferase